MSIVRGNVRSKSMKSIVKICAEVHKTVTKLCELRETEALRIARAENGLREWERKLP